MRCHSLLQPLPSSLAVEASDSVSIHSLIDMDGIRAACARNGLVVPESVESLVPDILALIFNEGLCCIAEKSVESFTEAFAAKKVTTAGFESELVVRKATLSQKWVPCVRRPKIADFSWSPR